MRWIHGRREGAVSARQARGHGDLCGLYASISAAPRVVAKNKLAGQ